MRANLLPEQFLLCPVASCADLSEAVGDAVSGPSTAFMEHAGAAALTTGEEPDFNDPCATSPAQHATESASGPAEPTGVAPAKLAERVMSHLAAALAYEQADTSMGWSHFERRWAEGCGLHRLLARSYESAGLHPRSAICDEDSGQWHVEPVRLDHAMPPACQLVRKLMNIYADVGTYNLLTPQARRLNRHASLVALASVTVVLDAAEIAPALLALLRDQGWLDRALWTREQTPRSLGQLFEFLASAGFRRLLGRAIGARRAARFYARMMTRLVPGIGRRLLVADVLWLVFEQWKAPQVVPDGTRLGQLRPSHERIARLSVARQASRPPYNSRSGGFSSSLHAYAAPVPMAGSLLHVTGMP